MNKIIRELESLPERAFSIMEIKNQIVTDTKMELHKEQKAKAV